MRGATAARQGGKAEAGSSGRDTHAGSLQRMVRRLADFKGRVQSDFWDWQLRRMPYRALAVKSPKKVRIWLMLDPGGDAPLLECEFVLTVVEAPRLVEAKNIIVSIDVWEDGGTEPSQKATSHLLPDSRRGPCRCRIAAPVSTIRGQ